MPSCARCGAGHGDDALFCSSCGAALTPEGRDPKQVRRMVTVVFSDISGSTALGELLDTESFHHVVASYHATMRSALERHGGTVQRFRGDDAVIALFGTPTLHEDDAMRAVRAASEMGRELEALNEELDRRWSLRLQSHTGVNTGEVVAGRSAGDSFVVGDAVNVAARLQQAAEPGEILIGEATHRLVRDAVTVEPIGALELKGKAQAVPAFRLLGAATTGQTKRLRFGSPLIGRTQELASLESALDGVRARRRCARMTVLGEPGVGKSRLADEFVDRVRGEVQVARGRCLPYGKGITFWPVIEVANELASVQDEDAPREVETKIGTIVADEAERSRIVAGVAGALGLSTAASDPEEIFWAVGRMLEVVARQAPLLLVLDDLQWGEPTFFDFVEYLEESVSAPILVLCLSRPDLDGIRPSFRDPDRCLALGPLSERDRAEMIKNLLGGLEGMEKFAQHIGRSTEGNPLFIEEMLRSLREEGLLEQSGGQWRTGQDLSSIRTPASVEALIGARIDRLAKAEREALERAAVMGEEFWPAGVAELSRRPMRARVMSDIEGLELKELIEPGGASFAGEPAFRFTHMLIREVAYNGILKESRSELHERLGAWLKRRVGDRIGEYEEIIGYHFEQACRFDRELGMLDEERANALAERAGEHLGNVGARAFSRGDMPAAVNLCERALVFVDRERPEWMKLSIDLLVALQNAGHTERAARLLDELIEDRGSGNHEQAQLTLALTHLMFLAKQGRGNAREELEELERVSRRVIPVFERQGYAYGVSVAWLGIAFPPFVCGRYHDAAEALTHCVAHMQAANDPRTAAEMFDWLTYALYGGPATEQTFLTSSGEFLRWSRGDKASQASSNYIQGFFRAMQGEYAHGRELYLAGRQLHAELGQKQKVVGFAIVGAAIEVLGGNLDSAEAELRAAVQGIYEIGETNIFLAHNAADLADLLARRDSEEAREFVQLARRFSSTNHAVPQARALIAEARLELGHGELDAATGLAAAAVNTSDRTDSLNLRGDASMMLAECLAGAGQNRDAVRAAKAAAGDYERKGNRVAYELALLQQRRFLEPGVVESPASG